MPPRSHGVSDSAVDYAAAVLNAHPDPLAIVVDDGHVRAANAAFLDLLSIDARQARARSVQELGLQLDEPGGVEAAIGRVLRTGVAIEKCRAELEQPGSRPLQLSLTARRIDLDRTRYHGALLSLARRPDGRFRAKKSGHNLALLHSISASTADLILTLTEDGVIETASAAVKRMFGYTPSEVAGMDLAVLISQTGEGTGVSRLKQALKDDDTRKTMRSPNEFVGVSKGGRRIPVEVAINEIDHENRFTAIIRDVSERKRLEQQVLDISTEEQRRIGLELHDDTLQALTGMQLIAEELIDLLEPGSRGEELARMLAETGAAAGRRARLLTRGLIPVRVPAGGFAAALESLAADVGELHGVTVTVEHQECSLAFADDDVSTHVYRILQEATSNAARHSGSDVVRISVAQDGERLLVRVADEGDGFDQGELSDDGGLGLKIMSYRADLIGAELSVETWRAGGTVVVLSVPFYGFEQDVAGIGRAPRLDA